MKASMSCLLKTLLAIFAFSLFSFPSSAKDVVYVRSGADGDGSSWTNAFGNLQQAVDSAEKKGADVWVSKGVYYAMDDNQYVVDLKPNVNLYGGFAGDEASLADRDTAKNPTILDGDGRTQVVFQENEFEVSDSVLIDGFTIKGGVADYGGGAYLKNNVTIKGCVFKENINAISASKSRILCSQIIYNKGVHILCCYQGSIVENCQILNNSSDSYGLGIYQSFLNRCTIIKNNSFEMLLEVNYDSRLTNCLISENISSSDILIRLWNGSLMSNCTVVKNEAKGNYGTFNEILGIALSTVQNSIIVGNKCERVVMTFDGYYDQPSSWVFNNMIESNDIDGNMDGSLKWAAFNDPVNGDYSLSEKSICINAGLDVDDSLDLYGNPRKQGSGVDLGAIESTHKDVSSLNVGEIVYVKIGSDGDGSSWKSAFGDIKSALTAASLDSKRHQIWVAKGTYYADSTSYNWLTLCPGVSLYGGFLGDETSLSERDVEKNPTFIDGMKSQRVITQPKDFADSMAVVIDGFTIQNGLRYLDEEGSIVNSKSNTTFCNCIFRYAYGGLSAIKAEKTSFKKCKFVDNYAPVIAIYGGVIDSCLFDGRGTNGISNVIYADNSLVSNSQISEYNFVSYLLRIYNNSIISHCKISDNESDGNTYSYYNPVLISLDNSTLSNSLVYGNRSIPYYNYGYILLLSQASSIDNSTIANNTNQNINTIHGYTNDGNRIPVIANSIIWGNKIIGENIPQVDKSEYIQILSCASDEDLVGENNIKLESSNNGSDTTKNYVCFINPVGGDYRLHSTSSCIDKGIDSLAKAEYDINGGVRIYGKAVDLGAIEYDGEYVEMPYYGQTICYNKYSFEATFDSTIDRIDWSVVDSGNIEGMDSLSGSGKTIPSMQLRTSKNDIDTLTLLVKTYDKDGSVGTSFHYEFIVYPDLSEKSVALVFPADTYVVNTQNNEMLIIWDRLEVPVSVEKYDLYVWRASDTIPSTPLISTIDNFRQRLNDLDNHTTYKYMVKAITHCDTINSEIKSFRIDKPVSLAIDGLSICEMGTKLNDTTYLRRHIKGFELTDSITYVISGKDSSDFSVKLSDSWNPLSGGYFDVCFTPKDLKKATSNAVLTFKSGNHIETMYLSGILANYYVYDAVVDNDIYNAGDTITIKGYVTDAYGNPYEGKNVKVTLKKGGYVYKTFDEITNEDGQVVVNYNSSRYESGIYSVGISMRGETSETEYAEFSILGISCEIDTDKWTLQKGTSQKGTISVTNRTNIEARNVKVKTLSLADGCVVEFDSIAVLGGLETVKVNYRLSGNSVTEGNRYLLSKFRVETEDGLTADFSTFFYCETPYGQIKVLPANIEEYVSKQNPKYIELKLINTGIGETGKISVALPVFDGMSMPNGTVIESIKAGDTVKTNLKLEYYEGAKLNIPYYGTIGFNCENGKSTSISYNMEYSSSQVGDVVVDVVDEYYYNTTSKKHLSGAKVKLLKEFNSNVVAYGITDSTGIVRFDSIPEGNYLLAVEADKHSNYKESITVQAGQTLNKFVFTSYQAVTYSWNVVRTEIEDKYQLDVVTEFETKVPVPVVTAEFPYGIPNKEDFVKGEPKIVYLVVSNHGLIAAKDVTIEVPKETSFLFTPDFDKIDSLPANTSVVVPITMEMLTSPECYFLDVKYYYECDGQVWKKTLVQIWSCSYAESANFVSNGPHDNSHREGYYYDVKQDSTGGYLNTVTSTHDYGCSDDNKQQEECIAKVDKGKDCLMDVIGMVPIVGDIVEGAYKFFKKFKKTKKVAEVVKKGKDLYDKAQAIDGAINTTRDVLDTYGDRMSNRISPREAASNLYEAGKFAAEFLPVDIPFGCLDWWCQAHSCEHNGVAADNCGEYLYDATHAYGGTLRSANVYDFYTSASSYVLAMHDIVEYVAFEVYKSRLIAECVGGDEKLMRKSGFVDFMDVVWDSIAYRKKIDLEKVKLIPVTDLSLTEMFAISERWNRTVDAWNDSVFASNEDYLDIADKSVVDKNIDGITNFYQYVVFRGFDDIEDMLEFDNDQMLEYNKGKSKSVCASVKLQMSQTMTMTREAFDGTLTVSNGNESGAMENFKVVIEIRDDKGELANDLFQINTEKLTGISAVDGTGEIASMSEGTALFRFIPTKMAAPVSPKNYSFGGYISYVDPASGDTVKADLYPVTLTVNPSPDLQIDYFMQRNILGDDALTLDRVEPSIPAALGVRIDNQGYGLAKNVKLETAQPEIVDNEKGLLIDFDIIGSSLNGKDCDLGSENINFGNIEPQSSKTGVWWMTSSLLGHFTKYDASVVHANSFGNPELSLVNGVSIHELIKTVDAYGAKEDGVSDFLVNDHKDAKDTPDAIYYSNGGKDTVKKAKSVDVDVVSLSLSDSVVTLSVVPSGTGWNYAQIADPGDNFYEIKRVVRLKDNVEIPLSNVWLTFVTLPDGEDPIYENRLHFLDYISTIEQTDYDIYYSIRKNILKVEDIYGTPESEGTDTLTVDSVIVTFNRKIQMESFDYNDMELYCQAGENLADSTIVVEKIDDYRYKVDISSKTKSNGYYKFVVNVNNVYDEAGYPGEFGKSASWVQFVLNPDTLILVNPDVIVNDSILPIVPDTIVSEDDPDDIKTSIVVVENDEFMVYSYQNSIYVRSSQSGSFDIYDVLSRMVAKDVHYGVGVSRVATLPKGVYIINGNKVIVQ